MTAHKKENSSRNRVKSNKCPPQVKDLIAFEEDLIGLVQQIRFRKVKSNFQRKLNKDLKTIKSSNITLTTKPQTCINSQKMSAITSSTIATYEKATNRTEDIINKEGIKYAKRADVFDRRKIYGTSNCFKTLKEHKENIANHPTTILINL